VKKDETFITLESKINSNVTFKDDLIADAPLRANQGDNPGEYWVSYFNSIAYNFKVGISAKVYKASLGATCVTLTEIPNGIIDIDKGVILKSTVAEIPIMLSESASAAGNYNGNDLYGVGVSTTQSTLYKYYVLSGGSKGVGFYRLQSDVQLAPNKAYIAVDASSSVRSFYGFGEEGDETEISGLSEDAGLSDNSWYDLSGRKLEGKPAEKGIYVKNGHKYLVK
jgi:hypothetical protein